MKSFSFSVDSALLGELGERLVPTVHLALAELVKNSYDADATVVTVEIGRDLDGTTSIIRVMDDGHGMSSTDVSNYWMRIGTTNKAKKQTSPRFGRPLTGKKGIGRFCCRRLGTKLFMDTTAAKGSLFETTTVSFDWTRFKAGTAVEDISCQGESRRSAFGAAGTTLKIEGGTFEDWTRSGFNYLRRQLALLTANRGTHRKGFDRDPGFRIVLNAEGFDQGEIIDLRDQLIDATWGTLAGKVDSKGKAHYTLVGKNLRSELSTASRFTNLIGAKIRIGIMPMDKAQYRDPDLLSLEVARELAKDWAGIQVRYNGFRVLPYGSPNDDWLEIDKDRSKRLGSPRQAEVLSLAKTLDNVDSTRALLNMLSNQNYIGGIETTDKIESLVLKADRVGFVENEALDELIAFARTGVEWATVLRENWLDQQQKAELEKVEADFIKLLDSPRPRKETVENQAFEVIEKNLNTLSSALPRAKALETKRITDQALEIVRSRRKIDTETLRKYRIMVSAASLTLIFSHEVRSVLALLTEAASKLGALAKTSQGAAKEKLAKQVNQLNLTSERFDELLELTSIVALPTGNEKATGLNLKEQCERAARCFELVTTSYGIEIDSSLIDPWNLKTGQMLKGELIAILLNALSNSIKAVIARGQKKRISIAASRVDGKIEIHFRDTGIGLSKTLFEDVFIELNSDPEEKMYPALQKRANPADQLILGQGSGFGLSIIRSIAEQYGGSAQFVEPMSPWQTDLKVLIP